jgi:hypothetical protein
MKTDLYDTNAVKEMIASGQHLLVAGDEDALGDLPQGSWIGGTIPYFMANQGGVCTKDQIFVSLLPEYVSSVKCKVYDETNINQVYNDAPAHGFSIIIIPASSPTHLTFALNAPAFPNFATRPLIGWVSGVHLSDLGKVAPKVFDGTQGKTLHNGAVVLHVGLPGDKLMEIGIVNIFEQGEGDTITFPESGFSAKEVLVNGRKANFAKYLTDNAIDTKLPLVADLYGAMINTSFQGVDVNKNQVDLYAPVFAGVEYKIAKPVGDFVKDFRARVPKDVGNNLIFSCNCILNYLYADLEGKKTADFTGPITFGEIAYQLLNQTLAYITIEDAH